MDTDKQSSLVQFDWLGTTFARWSKKSLGNSKTKQKKPWGTPMEFNQLAASVYGPNTGEWSVYKGCPGAHLYFRQFGLDRLGYECLEAHTFVGKGFGGPPSAEWQIELYKKTDPDTGEVIYIMAFEGTVSNAIGSWLMDVSAYFGLPHRLLKLMNKKIKSWQKKHSIDEFGLFIGHSAGCMMTLYSFSENDLKNVGSPWMVCFNGLDPKYTASPRQINFRTTGDAVSACWGARAQTSICSVAYPANMGVGGSHHLDSFDMSRLTWDQIDLDNYYNFEDGNLEGLLANKTQTEKAMRCNWDFLNRKYLKKTQRRSAQCADAMYNGV